MQTFTIGEVAEQTGFTTSALRYYEGVGLVTPTDRTPAGYRRYDQRAVARLAFIARAKRLGCSLAEITDLVSVWDGDRCGPVQRRFHDLVTQKIRTAQERIAELAVLAADLQRAAARLSTPAADGPCGEGCACMADTSPEPTAVSPGIKPSEPPIACTLEPEAIGPRLADWQGVLRAVVAREQTADGALRLQFGSGIAIDALAQLAAAEQGCCAFFGFAITVDGRGIALEVRVPDGAEDLMTAVFGAAA